MRDHLGFTSTFLRNSVAPSPGYLVARLGVYASVTTECRAGRRQKDARRRAAGREADSRAENVEFQPLGDGDEQTGHAEQRDLEPCAARRHIVNRTTRQKVLTDRIGRQREAEFRN